MRPMMNPCQPQGLLLAPPVPDVPPASTSFNPQQSCSRIATPPWLSGSDKDPLTYSHMASGCPSSLGASLAPQGKVSLSRAQGSSLGQAYTLSPSWEDAYKFRFPPPTLGM